MKKGGAKVNSCTGSPPTRSLLCRWQVDDKTLQNSRNIRALLTVSLIVKAGQCSERPYEDRIAPSGMPGSHKFVCSGCAHPRGQRECGVPSGKRSRSEREDRKRPQGGRVPCSKRTVSRNKFATSRKETDLPLTVGILVDTSRSQEGVLTQESHASSTFLTQVLRDGKDRAFVVRFDKRVETSGGLNLFAQRACRRSRSTDDS